MGMKLDSATRRKVLAASAPPPTPQLPAPPGTPGPGSGWRLVVTLPNLIVVSEANHRKHWSERLKRFKGHKQTVSEMLCWGHATGAFGRCE